MRYIGPNASVGRDEKAIRTPQVLEFLNALHVAVGCRPQVVWARLQAHRPKPLRPYVEAQRGASPERGQYCGHGKPRVGGANGQTDKR